MRKLFERYRDVIPYLFFGVCTTFMNIAVYWICAHLFSMGVMASTIFAWIAAVLFAYITNRKWVFHSEVKGVTAILRETVAFFGCRLATGILDWIMMFILVDCLHLNDLAIKILANIMVIILNYMASKIVIFRKQ